MSSIKYMTGVDPQLREYLALQEKAMAGDIVMVITPTTAGTEATAVAFTETVNISIETAAGQVHSWINADFATSLAATENCSGSGAVTSETTLSLVEGQMNVVISATGEFAAGEKITLTVDAITLAGISVTGGTFVDTIVAA